MPPEMVMVMQLTAIFEGWLLSDGSYPPLHRGQLVNLAFELRPTALHRRLPGSDRFESMSDAACRLHGTVRRVYSDEDPPVAVLEAEGFRCYLESPAVKELGAGAPIAADGTLAVDYYIWSEFLAEHYADAPNLFYALRVTRIRRVLIPEPAITQTDRSLAAPTALPLDDVAAEDVEEVETMVQVDRTKADAPASTLADYRPAFFLVDLAEEDVPPGETPRTFQ